MNIERKEKFIKITPDEEKILLFNRGWSSTIFAPLDFEISQVEEFDEADLTRAGMSWMAEKGFHYVKNETGENVGSMINLAEGDDIRNYYQEEDEI